MVGQNLTYAVQDLGQDISGQAAHHADNVAAEIGVVAHVVGGFQRVRIAAEPGYVLPEFGPQAVMR